MNILSTLDPIGPIECKHTCASNIGANKNVVLRGGTNRHNQPIVGNGKGVAKMIFGILTKDIIAHLSPGTVHPLKATDEPAIHDIGITTHGTHSHDRTVGRQRHRTTKFISGCITIQIGPSLNPLSRLIEQKHPNMANVVVLASPSGKHRPVGRQCNTNSKMITTTLAFHHKTNRCPSGGATIPREDPHNSRFRSGSTIILRGSHCNSRTIGRHGQRGTKLASSCRPNQISSTLNPVALVVHVHSNGTKLRGIRIGIQRTSSHNVPTRRKDNGSPKKVKCRRTVNVTPNLKPSEVSSGFCQLEYTNVTCRESVPVVGRCTNRNDRGIVGNNNSKTKLVASGFSIEILSHLNPLVGNKGVNPGMARVGAISVVERGTHNHRVAIT
mmetsp:Transcript_21010/g.35828  ORF Transcript_21010/g.35828 Transcript_21010/m.35828 type:complete len:384 (-) Transcript_21010:671-1822(-)